MGIHHIEPLGPFSLAASNDFAGGFAAGIGGGGTAGASLVMAFPIEPGASRIGAWQWSAVAELSQRERNGTVQVRIETDGDEAAVLRQALRCVSLDRDGRAWPEVGRRDPVIGSLQAEFGDLRPVCFYSAYEAATSFVIGQRISRLQSARIKARLSEEAGDVVLLDRRPFHAFPRPERLVELEEMAGLSGEKVRRLRGVAEAALDGRLDTERLRSLPPAQALAELRTLHGVGEFTAQGILLRGCGVVDELPDDALSDEVLEAMYGDELRRATTREAITDRWRPYRMWATVLLRVGWGRRDGRGASYRRERRAGDRANGQNAPRTDAPVT